MDSGNCKLDIINRSLSLLREQAIDNIIEPQTDSEKLALQWWQTALDEALVEIEPNFAISRAIVDRENIVDSETFKPIENKNDLQNSNSSEIISNRGYKYQYRIPNNCLKILDVDPNNCIIEGSYIYLDEPSNKHTFIFINRETQLYSREVKFNLALSYIIAFYMVADLQNSDEKIKAFLQLKTQKVSEARTYYHQQQGVKIIRKYEWKK